jgi:hypothetical protein
MDNTDLNNTIPNVLGSEHKEFLSVKTLVAITLLLVYTISAPVFERIHFHYIHESGVSMILGMVVTLIAMIVSPDVNYL